MCVKHSNRFKAKSVLSEAVHYDHIHLLQNSVLHRIVEEKWKAYGRKHAVVEAAAVCMSCVTVEVPCHFAWLLWLESRSDTP